VICTPARTWLWYKCSERNFKSSVTSAALWVAKGCTSGQQLCVSDRKKAVEHGCSSPPEVRRFNDRPDTQPG
jgi:hypothetical protein